MAKDTDEMSPEEEYELIKQRAGKDCVCGDCLRRAARK